MRSGYRTRAISGGTGPRTFFRVALLGWTLVNWAEAQQPAQPKTLLDLSGMAWVEEDLFLAVHDGKNEPDEIAWPRVSLVRLPKFELEGIRWRNLDVAFPGPQGRSHDLESVCRIPGSRAFLLCESGQKTRKYRRIFHAVLDNENLRIDSYIPWPVEITNVEASAVARVGGQFVFLYAERAEGLASTDIRWAKLSLEPLKIGEFQAVSYEAEDPTGERARPIVAMDVDSDGLIHIVSAYDSGNDDGPYRSVAWRIGKVSADTQGMPKVELCERQRLGTLDGLKVESICVRETPGEEKQVYIGTDDEHYGGILRLLP
ncbi:MAG: hypothetical protein HUU20_14270 [Pirellulales bacterium]|nr:hypothetical protein [Pirellulales bacterium]